MAEIMLDFIQCHHCGKTFDLDDSLAANVHWKDCQYSPAREEYEAMKALLLKIRDDLVYSGDHGLIHEIDALLGEEANG